MSIRNYGRRVQHRVYFGDLGINCSYSTDKWKCRHQSSLSNSRQQSHKDTLVCGTVLTCFVLLQNFQGNEAMFEAVEQQDLDAVQILLYQYTAEELDLNTPNSEGLTPLDIAIMTNNVPIARILLRTGARESPHCK